MTNGLQQVTNIDGSAAKGTFLFAHTCKRGHPCNCAGIDPASPKHRCTPAKRAAMRIIEGREVHEYRPLDITGIPDRVLSLIAATGVDFDTACQGANRLYI